MTTRPRILLVTPEVTYLPRSVRETYHCLNDRDGGLADISAALIQALYRLGADIHVALPHYRTIFKRHTVSGNSRWACAIDASHVPLERVHLAQDRAFYYVEQIEADGADQRLKIALAFQRDVINNIIPHVRPDLIHCNDWMTALIPAMSRYWDIPCLFSLHSLHSEHCPLQTVEERGIDTAPFRQNLYYEHYPADGHTGGNRIDLLTSAIFASHFVSTTSPTFLDEIVEGRHETIPAALRREIAAKVAAGCARGIPYAPDRTYDPARDMALARLYDAATHANGKKANKKALQRLLGLQTDSGAPLFFWPARIDPAHSGCQLMADTLYSLIDRHWERQLQVIFVADGPFQIHFKSIVEFHGFDKRVAVVGFDEEIARLAYGAADFVLAPSFFEPCGLIPMIGTLYGALPVAYDTGGIRDTLSPLDVDRDCGNSFLFTVFDAPGLTWAVDRAMDFFQRPDSLRASQVSRVMIESSRQFSHRKAARRYIALYEKMLQRPLLPQFEGQPRDQIPERPPAETTLPSLSAA
jgi:starch synthase/alpha-amylase